MFVLSFQYQLATYIILTFTFFLNIVKENELDKPGMSVVM